MTERAEMLNHVEALMGSRVLCIGDLMLDRFVYGVVERTSPEAPVPVLRIEKQTVMLGGAGNVVRNIVSLGASASLVSVVGDDTMGRELTTMVGSEPRVEPHLLLEPGRESTVKTRYVANGQQLLRADLESTHDIAELCAENLMRVAADSLSDCDVVVLSDYAKGVLTERVVRTLIADARAVGRPVIVDPKGRDFSRYRGASVITPNRHELADATGRPVESDDELVAAARQIIETYEIEAVLVTRSQDGLSVIPGDGEACHLPTQARSVYDVSGAGDTVVATFAVALGQAIALPVAAEIANLAAGIVVGKTGTATAFDWELRTALDMSGETGVQAKIKARGTLRDAVETWRESGLSVGFTNGCFDLLHPGHMSLLREAKSHCDRLVVAINSDQSVRRLKGPDRPIQLESARADILASLEMVDGITVFDEDTPEALIELLRPDVLVKGADYSLDEVVGGNFVESYGGKVVLAAIEPNFSTTDTIARMRKV
jgi:D-beta-D-heptose 7-phosphate kinase / D-beta-D-heptose 1-phosphate adenosyltransferase